MTKQRFLYSFISIVCVLLVGGTTLASAFPGDSENFDAVWPGAICKADQYNTNTDYYSNGGAIQNDDGSTVTFHCPLETRQNHATYIEPFTGDVTYYEITTPKGRVKMRVDDQSGSDMSCTLYRWRMTRSTGATAFHASDSESTSGTGFQTLTFDDMSAISPSSTYTYYYHVACSVPSGHKIQSIMAYDAI